MTRSPRPPLPSTWVLLRGLTRERGHWGDFMGLLAESLPEGAALVAPDLPGNGARYREASPLTVQEMMEAVRRDLVDRGLPPPYHLLTMSLGAMVAVAWAQHHPQELHSAVLINTSVRSFSPAWHRMRPASLWQVLKLAVTRPDPATLETAILRMTCNHPATPADTVAAWQALRTRHPVSLRNAVRQLVAATRFRPQPEPPSVPLLLLQGLGDRLVDPRCSQALARQWRLPLKAHPTGGHDLPLDAPQWVVEQVRQWALDLRNP